jgi:hypothetical protein
MVNGSCHFTLMFNDLLAEQVTKLDDRGILVQQLPTKNLVPNLLVPSIESMHVNATHASQCDDYTNPAALAGPLAFEAKDGFELHVVLIDEQYVFINKMRKLWPW